MSGVLDWLERVLFQAPVDWPPAIPHGWLEWVLAISCLIAGVCIGRLSKR